ncbi:MAG: sigma 54-interacting transcriptional regulator [Byssovorax sp.]
MRHGTLPARIAHRYRVLRELGRGGLGAALLVRDEALGVERCLKLVEAPGGGALLAAEFGLLAGLAHPSLAAVHDFGVTRAEGREAFYFTADFVRGVPLDRFAAGASFAEVRAALLGPLAALSFLHRAGIRHGDLKPENILVGERGGVLIDLSCAARIGKRAALGPSGTPGFLAPEILRGEPGDARADLYGLGRLLLALGEIVREPLPADVAALAERLSAEQPSRRPGEVREVLEALGAPAEALHVAARRPSAILGRDEELRRGEQAIGALRRGEPGPRLVVIEGPPGAGKSRLLRELAWRAELSGDAVEGFALPGGGAITAMLARALDEPALDAGGVETALARLGSRNDTAVLIVDDVEQLSPADRADLDRIAAALRADGPVLLLAADLRDEGAPSLASRSAASCLLSLGPLDEAAVRAWAEDLGIGEAAAALFRMSGGHPADVAEVAERVLAGEAACEAGLAARRAQMQRAERMAAEARSIVEHVEAAEALRLAGASPRALALLDAIDLAPLAPAEVSAVLAERAYGLLARGAPKDALSHAERALALLPTARASDAAARAEVRLGQHAEALARAEAALPRAALPVEQADLHEIAGVAASYAGRRDAAQAHLAAAVALLGDLSSPRRLVRVLSYQAIDAYRAGELTAALLGHQRALSVAEGAGLVEQVARLCLNVATAHHQRGAYGEALAVYERGERTAAALGQADLLAIFELDLAKLWADLGAWDRAEQRALRAERASLRGGAGFFVAAARSVLGDCALARGDARAALACFEASREGFVRAESAREVSEEELEIARAHLASGDLGPARAALARARDGQGIAEAPDLAARAALLEGRAALAAGEELTAMRTFASARALAERAGSRDLLAEALLAKGDAEAARSLWAAMEAELPEPLRAAFRAHPRRRLPPPPAPPEIVAAPTNPPSAEPRREDRLPRLLALFRKLNSTAETPQILGMALDAAIDLTGAERGFVILDDPESGERYVPVARNVDREKVGKSHLKYSRAIAEQAIAAAEPVITVDASADDRFRERQSVHAMRLRSVIAVPIRSPDGVLGALYLDNRFSGARFGREEADLLLIFADQVALALRNARTIEALRRRTRELEEERRRVDDLLAGKDARIDALAEEVRAKQQALEHRYDYRSIVGRGPAMARLFHTLDRVIDSPAPVLVLGESGTGKELVARAIHFQSARRGGPFVGLNCAALPASLLESELFGHVRGAFTGADRDRVGLVVEARGGTLFLDELGEMPLEIQAKLLRVIQEREVRPVGASASVPVDFRLVSATNRDLRAEVARGRFREDLYYRVGVVEVLLPPLRERLEDLPDLARHFVARAASGLGRAAPRITPAALRKLGAYAFPGNVRELENLITKAVIFAQGGEIGPSDIELPRAAKTTAPRALKPKEERALILAALERTGWNAALAARDLAMPRATFYRRLDRHGITRPVR